MSVDDRPTSSCSTSLLRFAARADLAQVADLDYEVFSPYGTAESAEIFGRRLLVFVLETTHAQGLYERLGFHCTGERTQDGVTLTIMQLDWASPVAGIDVLSKSG